jgi:two-component system cell cycle sensor histidine kinase/response regulator CckA
VHEAGDGAAALEVLQERSSHIDLVITDIVMPGMSGIKLAEEIEARWPVMKLMFVSGYAQNATTGSSDITSRVPVLGKPFTPSRIAMAVRDLLDNRPPSPHIVDSR